MGRLTLQTISNYKVKLRKLRRLLAVLPPGDERDKCVSQIARMTDQLGMEMTDLEIQLSRGPGRPRINPDMTAVPTKVDEVKTAPSKEELEALRKEKMEALKARVMADNPDLKEAEERSQRELEALLKTGGDNEGSKQATDDAKASGGADQNR